MRQAYRHLQAVAIGRGRQVWNALQGRRDPGSQQRLGYPTIDVDADVLYVDNGCLLTSAGAAEAFDLCLHLVRRDLGAEIAAEVARAAVMPLERAGGAD